MSPLIGGKLLGTEKLLVNQAQILRDVSQDDDLGARTSREWEEIATVACFLWWGTGATITRMGDIQGRPEATVDVNLGGMLIPQGTDVTARDRIGTISDPSGNTIEDGPFEIVAVSNFEGITEVTIRRFT